MYGIIINISMDYLIYFKFIFEGGYMKKKRSILVILSLVLTLFLTSCGKKPDATVDTLFGAMKAFDLEKMQSVIDPENSKKESSDFTNFEEMIKNEEGSTKAILEYCKEKAQKIEYTIKDSKVEKDKATVNVHVKHVDGTDIMSKTMEEFMKQGSELDAADDEASQEESDKLFVSIFDKIAKESEDKMVEKDIVVNLVNKDNKWYVEDFNDDLLNIVLANFLNAFF